MSEPRGVISSFLCQFGKKIDAAEKRLRMAVFHEKRRDESWQKNTLGKQPRKA
jgi:hypothetical protein